MKKILATLLVISFISKGLLAFEGTVSVKYTGADAKTNYALTWYFTPADCRLDMLYTGAESNGKATAIIHDAATNAIVMYTPKAATPEEKVYYKPTISNAPDLGDVKATATGETKDIAGFKCEKVVLKYAAGTTEAWIAKGIDADWNKLSSFFKMPTETQLLSKAGVKGFPLEAISKNTDGAVTAKITLEMAKAEKLPAATFQLPAGFTLFGAAAGAK